MPANRRAWAWTAGVLALAGLPYLPALSAFWVGDDYNYVVPKSADTILNFFNPLGRAQYRPFNWLSWVFDYTLYGPAPPGWHVTQLLMHVLTTLLIVLLLQELARAWWPGGAALIRWVPLLAGALFAVQPAHPEAVLWIGGRADVPFALGLFLACWAFARWRRGGRTTPGWYLLAVVGTWLSLLGKEAGLVTPLALLLVDWGLGSRPAAPGQGTAGTALAVPAVPWPGAVWGLVQGGLRVGGFLVGFVGPLVWLSQAGSGLEGLATTWARLTPLALLLVGVWWPRSVSTVDPARPGSRVAVLIRDQVPFWSMAAAYAGLRVGLYLIGQGRLMYGPEAHLQFNPLTLVDSAAGYLLIGAGVWDAPLHLAAWPLLLRLGVLGLALIAAVVAVRRLGRPALFAVLWVPATVIITYDTAADRWFYVPSLGLCLLAALVLGRLAAARPALGLTLAGALVLIWGAVTVDVNLRWVASGEVARAILAQIRTLHPNPARPATFYMANPPYSYAEVLLFNSGFAEAPSFAYQDYTQVRGYELQEHAAQVQAALADPGRVGPHPVFLRYEGGRLVDYPSLAALAAAQATAPEPPGSPSP